MQTIHEARLIYTDDRAYGHHGLIIRVELREESRPRTRTIDLEPVSEPLLLLSISGSYGLICTNPPRPNQDEVAFDREKCNSLRTDACGQITTTAEQFSEHCSKAAQIREIVSVWQRWHLNDLRAGTREQMAAIAHIQKNHFWYEDACEHLKEIGLYEDRGYKFGHAWLYEPMPENVIAQIKSWQHNPNK